MEQPCYKCGQAVEEGRPFCPHCAAPQIRVLVAEPAMAAAAESGPGILAGHAGADIPRPALAVSLGWSEAFRPCALAALVACVLMVLIPRPIVAMISVGFLAVMFYRQGRRELQIPARIGAALGALAGLMWFAMSSIMAVSIVLIEHRGAEIRDELIKRLQQSTPPTPDPQVIAMMDWFKSPGGLEFLMILGILFGLVASIVLGGLGGAICAAILGRRNRV